MVYKPLRVLTCLHLACNHSTMSNIPVHTGQWIDWSYGLVLGSYRTFTVRDTLYIIGATSAFLTLVGGGVWNIVAFIYHQTLAKKEPDIITLQHRSIYRNDSTATSAILDAFWVYWQWKPWRLCGRRRRVGTSGPLKHLWPPHRRPKKRAKHVGMRTCLLMLPALTIFSGFVVAGIFGSHIAAPAYKSNTMLVATRLDQGTCGITLFDDTIEAVTAFDIDVANRTRAAVSYARSCYSPPSGSVNAVSCSLFANSKLEYEADDTECPFEDSMCAINSSTPAHRLRTKPLDSHHDFGINAPAFQRLKLLKETICAPLIVHGFTSTSSANGAEGINNRSTMTNYNYGAVPNVGDATWQYNTASAYDNVPFEIL